MSRKKILKAIKQNKPGASPLPEIRPDDFRDEIDLTDAFISNAGLTASRVMQPVDKGDFIKQLKALYPDTKKTCSLAGDWFTGSFDIHTMKDPREMEDLDLLVVRGVHGVAENGAVWVPESNMGHRALPFITKHLALLLDKGQIVQNMHEAYALLSGYDQGFGVFISGPSKTADIEQSLVIGAQSALTTTIFLV